MQLCRHGTRVHGVLCAGNEVGDEGARGLGEALAQLTGLSSLVIDLGGAPTGWHTRQRCWGSKQVGDGDEE